MKGQTIAVIGVAAVGALYLFNKSASPGNLQQQSLNSQIVPGTNTTYPYIIPGAPAMPSFFNQAYYQNYIRPAMVQVNPNVNNPAYTLSQTDANNYLANYVDLQQWLQSFKSGTPLQHLQYHWHTYGVPDQRTFLPLPWNDPAQWTPPPKNPNSSGSGSTFGSILGTVASVAIAILGTDQQPVLNDGEVELIVTGGLIVKQILPFYEAQDPKDVTKINTALDNLVTQYN